ncbi:hypothetical protein QMTAC487_10000 [Sphaerotilus sp. FB-3]|nr:hypothetical protein QMTAC487_10000 [Sphaerotilus sp. FB-3]
MPEPDPGRQPDVVPCTFQPGHRLQGPEDAHRQGGNGVSVHAAHPRPVDITLIPVLFLGRVRFVGAWGFIEAAGLVDPRVSP